MITEYIDSALSTVPQSLKRRRIVKTLNFSNRQSVKSLVSVHLFVARIFFQRVIHIKWRLLLWFVIFIIISKTYFSQASITLTFLTSLK